VRHFATAAVIAIDQIGQNGLDERLIQQHRRRSGKLG
jgi:hypothetical protein